MNFFPLCKTIALAYFTSYLGNQNLVRGYVSTFEQFGKIPGENCLLRLLQEAPGYFKTSCHQSIPVLAGAGFTDRKNVFFC